MTRLWYVSMLVMALLPAVLMAQTEGECDYDGSGNVDFPDFLAFASAYGSNQARFDLDGDGRVNFPDFLAFARVFGRKVDSYTGRRSMSVPLPGGETMGFVEIEPGTFVMGTRHTERILLDMSQQWDAAYQDELPAHQVTISKGFYLGKHEVTQAQWRAVMTTEPWAGLPYRPENPALHVSWEDAQAFIRRLNDAAGVSLYRLPTEAEWEYACRAGTESVWSCGDNQKQLRQYAWYYDPSNVVSRDPYHPWGTVTVYAGPTTTKPVGRKQPNPWGLYDMHGNVFEWVQDWYLHLYYGVSPNANPPGPPKGSERVIRGGFYKNPAAQVRSAYRNHVPPTTASGNIGFRVVREIP